MVFVAATERTVAFLQEAQLKIVRMKELVAEVALDNRLVGQYDLVELPAEGRRPLADKHVRGVDGLEYIAVDDNRPVLRGVGVVFVHKQDERVFGRGYRRFVTDY